MTRENVEKIVGGVFFVGFIAAHLIFGINTAVKVLGLACVVFGLFCAIDRSVPVGIEGRPPSFFIRGIGALLVGFLMAGLGAFLMLFSNQAACIFGWSTALACS